jgi:hypothetical protein
MDYINVYTNIIFIILNNNKGLLEVYIQQYL